MSTSNTYASSLERKRYGPSGIEAEHCHGSEHERRQNDHPRKLIWKCVQPDSQALELQTPFDACTKCKEGKEYNVAYNAAAHFKRCHLRPAKNGRGLRAPAATTVAAVVPGVSVLKDLGYLAQFEVPDTEHQNTGESNPSGPMEDFIAHDTYAGHNPGCSNDIYDAFDAIGPFKGLYGFNVIDNDNPYATNYGGAYSIPANLHMAFPEPESSCSPTEARSSFKSEFSSLSSGSVSCQITPADRIDTWFSMDNDATHSVRFQYHAEEQSAYETTQQSENALSTTDCTILASHDLDLEESLRQKLWLLSSPPDPVVQHSVYEFPIDPQLCANVDNPAVQEASEPQQRIKQTTGVSYGSTLVSKDSELSITEGNDTLTVHGASGHDSSSNLLMSRDIPTKQGGPSCASNTQDGHTYTTSSPYAADEQTHHMIIQDSEVATTPEDWKSQKSVGLVEDSAYPADSPHYSFETLSATPESASQQNAQRNPIAHIAHRLQQLRAQYEALDESDDYDSSSDSNTENDSDFNDGSNESSGTSQYTEICTNYQNEGRPPESDSPGSSDSNVSRGQSFSGSTNNNVSHNTHQHKSERNGTLEDRSGSKIIQAVARSHRHKDQADILPCPLSSVISCTGKDKDMATLE
jgi:hypothetical protein